MAPPGTEPTRKMIIAALETAKADYEERYRMTSEELVMRIRDKQWPAFDDVGTWLTIITCLNIYKERSEPAKGKPK